MNTDEPITYAEMYAAYEDCRKRKKNTDGAMKFEEYSLYNIQVLTDEINNRRYVPRRHECFVVKYPTVREVFCANFRDRVVQHFVYNELNPILDRKLIYDTASCRKEKGTDFAIERLQTFVRRETNNYTGPAFYGKFDLSGFFMAIDRDRVLNLMVETVETEYRGNHKSTLLYLLPILILSDVTKNVKFLSPKSDWDKLPKRKTLFGNPYGLPIGNITSQMFANFYLNDMDHMIKARHKSYVRFVDDFVIVDRDKQRIVETRNIIEEYLPSINQHLNTRKTQIKDVKYGINFLGVTVKPYYSCLSSKRINRLYYTSSLVDTPEKFLCSANSHKGTFERYHGYRVAKRWYESMSEEFTEFIKMGSDCKCVDIRKPKKTKQTKLFKLSEDINYGV